MAGAGGTVKKEEVTAEDFVAGAVGDAEEGFASLLRTPGVRVLTLHGEGDDGFGRGRIQLVGMCSSLCLLTSVLLDTICR